MSSTITKTSSPSLRDYQNEAADFLYNRDECYLAAQMGAGKTAIALSALDALLGDGVVDRALVVAPLRVCELVWPQEKELWAPGLTMALCTGTLNRRVKALEANAQITVINYENLVWLVEHYGKAARWPFDALIFDESTRMKNQASKRWKAMRKILRKTRWRCAMSGTPTTQGLVDLWPQLYLVDKGKALGEQVGMFRRNWFWYDEERMKWVPRKTAMKEITTRCRDAGIFHKVEDKDYAAQLPELVRNFIDVRLPPRVLKLKERLRKDRVLPEYDVSAGSPGVLTQKLHQMSDGFVYSDEGKTHWLHDAKLDALEEVIEQGENLLVVYHYRAELEAMQKRWPAPYLGQGVSAKAAKSAVDEWNAGHLPILYLHPDSAGHGLNLQFGGNHLVWVGLPYSLEQWQQVIARLHRGGQASSTVWNHLLVAQGEDDAKILDVLRGKASVQRAVLAAV